MERAQRLMETEPTAAAALTPLACNACIRSYPRNIKLVRAKDVRVPSPPPLLRLPLQRRHGVDMLGSMNRFTMGRGRVLCRFYLV